MQVQLTATDLETALEAVMTIGQPTAKKKKDSEAEDIVPGSGIRMTANKTDGLLTLESQNDGTYILYKIRADIEDNGSAIIQGKRLLQLVKLFSSGITISKNDDENKIRLYDSANANYDLQTLVVEGPIVPEQKPADYVVRSSAIQAIARRCGRITKRSDVVVPLSSIQIKFKADETAICYASNGYNLCRFSLQQTGNGIDTTLLILPGVATIIGTLGNNSDVNINVSGQTLQAFNETFFLSTPKITGEYPDCERVINSTFKAENEIALNKDRLKEAVSRASLVGNDVTNGKGYSRITMQSFGTYVSIEAVSEVGQAIETIFPDSKTGEIGKVALNADNFMSAIDGCDGDVLKICYTGPNIPIRVSTTSNELLYVLSTIRTN